MEDRTIPDELLGAAVRSAEAELNAAITRAWRAGMRIDVETVELQQLGQAHEHVMVHVEAYLPPDD